LRFVCCGVDNLGDKPLNEFLLPRLFSEILGLEGEWSILGMGSILGMLKEEDCDRKLLVWSSGFQYDGGTRPRNAKYFCVRGEYTCKALGLDSSLAVADGSILMPMFLPRDREPSEKLGIVMKYVWEGPQSEWLWTTKVGDLGIVGWMRKLWSFENILTDSLHAAILADAYGIPWRPMRWEPKWEDHFKQLGMSRGREFLSFSSRDLMLQRQRELMQAAENLVRFVKEEYSQSGNI